MNQVLKEKDKKIQGEEKIKHLSEISSLLRKSFQRNRNLKDAAAGEHYEWTEMYENFAKDAEEEGFKKIATAYKLIAKVEAEHEARYRKLLENNRNRSR